jgi:TPR repeat protein
MHRAVVVLLLGLVFSSDSLSSKPVSKMLFLALMLDELPREFCALESVGGSCFSMMKSKCIEQYSLKLHHCISGMSSSIPANITNEKEAFYMGSNLGRCAGNAFRIENIQSFNLSKNCAHSLSNLPLDDLNKIRQQEIKEIEKAKRFVQLKDYASALEEYSLLSKKGNAVAMFALAEMHMFGDGVPIDPQKAFEYYKGSAEAGWDSAQLNLALMYENGKGVKQNYKEAYQWYSLATLQSNGRAANHLGYMLENGLGVEKNLDAAIKLYKLSAELGDEEGQFNLANKYRVGQIVDKDYTEAFRWFEQSASSGHVGSQKMLGIFYQNGLGTQIDYKSAIKWYELASEKGDAEAQYNLAHMYRVGLGTEVNHKKSFRLLKGAAEQGDNKAQYNLGLLYYLGQGVSQSFKKAYMWLKISQYGNRDPEKEAVQTVLSYMAPEEIDQAKLMISLCIKRNLKEC